MMNEETTDAPIEDAINQDKSPLDMEKGGEEKNQEELPDHETGRAVKNGWCGKDQWRGDLDDWVSAKKFNEHREMMGSIRDLTQRLNGQEEQFNSRLKNQHTLHEASSKALID